MAPVPVTKVACDGVTYTCTAKLVREFLTHLYTHNWCRKFQDHGDGDWVAQWSTSVFHQVPTFSQEAIVSCTYQIQRQKPWQETLSFRARWARLPSNGLLAMVVLSSAPLAWWGSPLTLILVSSIDDIDIVSSSRFTVMGTGWHSGSPLSSIRVSKTASAKPNMTSPTSQDDYLPFCDELLPFVYKYYYAIYEMYNNENVTFVVQNFQPGQESPGFEVGLTYLFVGFIFNPSFISITRNRLLIYLHQIIQHL